MSDSLFPDPPSDGPYSRPLASYRQPLSPECGLDVPAEDRPRLSRQCEAILNRLRSGRASNDELSKMARKYTGRVSEIREAGHDVRCLEQNHQTGVTWYALFENGVEVGANFTN